MGPAADRGDHVTRAPTSMMEVVLGKEVAVMGVVLGKEVAVMMLGLGK